MTACASIFGALVLLAGTIAADGQSAASVQQITPSDIARSLGEKGIVVDPAQVNMLATVPTHVKHPALEALRLESLSASTSRVLLRCADRTSCIPFYAVVNGLAPGEQISDQRQPIKNLSKAIAERGPLVVKQGTAATLQIISADMLITIPVICLQNGRQGERIKVTSRDRLNTYMGEIVTKGLLRSQL